MFTAPRKLTILQPGAVLDVATHTYTLNGKPVASSVTKRIHQDIVPSRFDATFMSANVFASCQRMRADPTAAWTDKQLESFAKYGQYSSAAEVAARWEEVRDNGTETHRTIEDLLRRRITISDPRANTPEVLLFRHFYDWFTRKYEVIAVEATIIVPSIDTGGQIDCIARRRGSRGKKIVLIDWKTMAPRTITTSEQSGYCGFYNMPRCRRAEQTVQLNMYASMIERQTDYRVERMILVYLDAEFGMWDKGEVERLPVETDAYIAHLERLVQLSIE